MTLRLHRSILSLAATGLLAFTLVACQGANPENDAANPVVTGSPSASPTTSNSPSASPEASAESVFAPKLDMSEGNEIFEITDGAGSLITLKVPHPVATLSGVDAAIATKFATAVDGHQAAVFEQAKAYSNIPIDDCQESCEREAGFALEHAGIYQDFATVASVSGFTFGTRDRNPGVHSVTMNLTTGELADVATFMDVGEPQTVARATTALEATENWAYCQDSAADYLASAGAFAPTDEGLLLLWAIDATSTAQCGVEKVTVPWEVEGSAAAPDSADAKKSAPAATDINGRWCPTAESAGAGGCVIVALPNVTDESGGQVSSIRHIGDAAGGFQFAGEGAPFGDYYPAGTAIDLPTYYSGADFLDQDRIWNSQTAVLMVRQ